MEQEEGERDVRMPTLVLPGFSGPQDSGVCVRERVCVCVGVKVIVCVWGGGFLGPQDSGRDNCVTCVCVLCV